MALAQRVVIFCLLLAYPGETSASVDDEGKGTNGATAENMRRLLSPELKVEGETSPTGDGKSMVIRFLQKNKEDAKEDEEEDGSTNKDEEETEKIIQEKGDATRKKDEENGEGKSGNQEEKTGANVKQEVDANRKNNEEENEEEDNSRNQEKETEIKVQDKQEKKKQPNGRRKGKGKKRWSWKVNHKKSLKGKRGKGKKDKQKKEEQPNAGQEAVLNGEKIRQTIQEKEKAMDEIDAELEKVQILTTPIGDERPSDDAIREMDAAVTGVQTTLTECKKACETAALDARGPHKESLQKLLARCAAAQTKLNEIKETTREQIDRVKCEQILKEAQHKSDKVNEAIDKTEQAETPYLKGLDALPLEEPTQAVSDSEDKQDEEQPNDGQEEPRKSFSRELKRTSSEYDRLADDEDKDKKDTKQVADKKDDDDDSKKADDKNKDEKDTKQEADKKDDDDDSKKADDKDDNKDTKQVADKKDDDDEVNPDNGAMKYWWLSVFIGIATIGVCAYKCLARDRPSYTLAADAVNEESIEDEQKTNDWLRASMDEPTKRTETETMKKVKKWFGILFAPLIAGTVIWIYLHEVSFWRLLSFTGFTQEDFIKKTNKVLADVQERKCSFITYTQPDGFDSCAADHPKINGLKDILGAMFYFVGFLSLLVMIGAINPLRYYYSQASLWKQCEESILVSLSKLLVAATVTVALAPMCTDIIFDGFALEEFLSKGQTEYFFINLTDNFEKGLRHLEVFTLIKIMSQAEGFLEGIVSIFVQGYATIHNDAWVLITSVVFSILTLSKSFASCDMRGHVSRTHNSIAVVVGVAPTMSMPFFLVVVYRVASVTSRLLLCILFQEAMHEDIVLFGMSSGAPALAFLDLIAQAAIVFRSTKDRERLIFSIPNILSPLEPLLHGGDAIWTTNISWHAIAHIVEEVVAILVVAFTHGFNLDRKMLFVQVFVMTTVTKYPLLLLIRKRCAYPVDPNSLSLYDAIQPPIPKRLIGIAYSMDESEYSEVIEEKTGDGCLEIEMDSGRYSDGHLMCLMWCIYNAKFEKSYVRKVDLTGSQITDLGIKELAKHCTGLTKINLGDTNVTDAGVKELAKYCKDLTSINLINCSQVTDDGVKELAKYCKDLTSIYLLNCSQVTDDGVKELAKNCPGLTNINLDFCYVITDTAVKELAKNCPGLTNVSLYNCREITDIEVKDLAVNCKGLTTITVTGTNVTDVGVKELAKNCKDLTSIDLSNCYNITDEGVKDLAVNCKGLTTIKLNVTRVTDAGVKELAKHCTGLTAIYLSETSVTDAGVKELKTKLPRCKVWASQFGYKEA